MARVPSFSDVYNATYKILSKLYPTVSKGEVKNLTLTIIENNTNIIELYKPELRRLVKKDPKIKKEVKTFLKYRKLEDIAKGEKCTIKITNQSTD